MRQWTDAEKLRQAEIIQRVKPWEKSTGPRTVEGKEKSKMNAYQDGFYSQEGKKEHELVRSFIKIGRILYSKPKKIIIPKEIIKFLVSIKK